MKLPAGLITKPDWLRLSTHAVMVPSLPQLSVWKTAASSPEAA